MDEVLTHTGFGHTHQVHLIYLVFEHCAYFLIPQPAGFVDHVKYVLELCIIFKQLFAHTLNVIATVSVVRLHHFFERTLLAFLGYLSHLTGYESIA